ASRFDLGRVHDARDGSYGVRELRLLDAELFASGGGEPIVSGATFRGRRAPLGGDPAFGEHALQGGVERAFLDAQRFVRHALNVLRDAVAVQRAEAQRLEGEHLESPGDEVALFTWHI